MSVDASIPRPPRDARLRRFGWGLSLPFRLLARVWRDPEARRALVRVCGTQALVALVVTAAIGGGAFFGVMKLIAWARAHPGAHIQIDDADRPRVLAKQIGGAVVGLFSGIQWCVIALSREHHEQLGRRASTLSGVEPEDPEASPRVRLNLAWLWKRVKRWARGTLVFSSALPIALLVSAPFLSLHWNQRVQGLVMIAWGWYLSAVFAGAKSAYAWRSESDANASAPWFVRWPSRVPIVRWYARLWARLTRSVFPPMREAEQNLFEMLGLAVARATLGVPIVYVFVRPFLPVAAAHVITTKPAER